MIRDPWLTPRRVVEAHDLVNEISILLRTRYPSLVMPYGAQTAIARELECSPSAVHSTARELGYRVER